MEAATLEQRRDREDSAMTTKLKGFTMFVQDTSRGGLATLAYPAIRFMKSNGGQLDFNARALAHAGVDFTTGIVLFFNEAQGLLAIRAPEKTDPFGSKMDFKGKPPKVPLAQFVARYGIQLDKLKTPLRLGWDEKANIAMVRLPAGSWEREIAEPAMPSVSGWGKESSNGKPLPRTIQQRREAAGR